MTTKTPRLGLKLLAPAQEQPEVLINEDLVLLDALGGSVEVEAFGDSPGQLRATKLIFVNCTVEVQTDGVVVITPNSETGGGGGGGGSPLDVTDGTHDVAAVSTIRFLRGAVVSEASGGVADVYIDPTSGGAGGGNLSPENPPAAPDALDDEFLLAAGAALDSGWTWVNQATTTAVHSGDGSIFVSEPTTGSGAGFTGFYKAAPAAPWTIQGRIAANVQINGQNNAFFGLSVYNSATNKWYVIGPMNSSGGIGAHPVLSFSTSFPASSGALVYANGADQFAYGFQSDWTFYRIENDATTLHFKISKTGVEGSYVTVASVAIAGFIGAVDHIGFANNVGYGVQAWADHFRVL